MLHPLTVRVLVTAAAVLGGFYAVWLSRPVLVFLLCAVLLCAALAPVVDALTRRRVPRAVAVAAVLLAVVGAGAGAVVVLVPPLIDGVDSLVGDVPEWTQQLRESSTFRDLDQRYELSSQLEAAAQKLPEQVQSAMGVLQKATVGVLSALVGAVMVLVLAAYMLLDGPRLMAWLRRELPDVQAQRLARLVAGVRTAVAGYVLAVALLGVLAGVSTYVVLMLLGVGAALPLAALMAAASLIPMVGGPVAALVIAFVALFTSPTAALIWAVFYVVYQQVENHVVQPMIYRRTVSLHPLVVIPALAVGTAHMGVLGALLSVPVAACAQVALLDWWRHRDGRPLVASSADATKVSLVVERPAVGSRAAGEPRPPAAE